MHTKDSATDALVKWHFEIESGLLLVYRILGGNEDDPAEPIKLIEVNTNTVSTGRLELFGFTATKDIPYPTLIAEVTPEELKKIKAAGGLPDGWDLDRARQYERSAA